MLLPQTYLSGSDIFIFIALTSLCAVDCDLPDEVVEALAVEFLPDRTYTGLPVRRELGKGKGHYVV